MRCGARLCPICQAGKATRWSRRAGRVVGELARRPSRWAFLTLTVRNCPLEQLRPELTKLHRGLKRLAARQEFAASGWLRHTEVTLNRVDGTAHPHLHLLLELPADYFRTPTRTVKGKRGRPKILPGYMTQARLVEMWGEALGVDYKPSVRIQAVRMKGKARNRREVALRDVLLEVCKYGVKPAELLELSADQVRDMSDQLRNVRLVGTGGTLRPPFAKLRLEQLADGFREAMIRRANAAGPMPVAKQLAEVARWDPKARGYARQAVADELRELPADGPAGHATSPEWWVARPVRALELATWQARRSARRVWEMPEGLNDRAPTTADEIGQALWEIMGHGDARELRRRAPLERDHTSEMDSAERDQVRYRVQRERVHVVARIYSNMGGKDGE